MKCSPADEVSCLHGIRVLTITAIALAHSQIAIFMMSPLSNRDRTLQVSPIVIEPFLCAIFSKKIVYLL